MKKLIDTYTRKDYPINEFAVYSDNTDGKERVVIEFRGTVYKLLLSKREAKSFSEGLVDTAIRTNRQKN